MKIKINKKSFEVYQDRAWLVIPTINEKNVYNAGVLILINSLRHRIRELCGVVERSKSSRLSLWEINCIKESTKGTYRYDKNDPIRAMCEAVCIVSTIVANITDHLNWIGGSNPGPSFEFFDNSVDATTHYARCETPSDGYYQAVLEKNITAFTNVIKNPRTSDEIATTVVNLANAFHTVVDIYSKKPWIKLQVKTPIVKLKS